jgi:large subunit ribosomal protein L31e
MAKEESKTENIEREYIIPLRREINKVPRYRKTEKAIKAIKQFLVRHMKIYDRDLNKIKIDKYLNEEMWHRGIRNPPVKIKVKAIKEKDKKGNEIVRVKLAQFSEKLKFKKAREEKIIEKSKEKKKKKVETEQKQEQVSTEEETKIETQEKQKEQEEKKASVVEEGQKIAQQHHKQEKHQISGKQKEPKRQKRMALAK